MREYIFTEREKEMLRKWMKDGKETKTIQNLFSRMRRIKPRLLEDMEFFFEMRRRLVEQHRWHLNVPRSTYGSRLGASESTPKKKG